MMLDSAPAVEIANAYRLARIIGYLEVPGGKRAVTNAHIVDMLLGRFHRQANAEGLTTEEITRILDRVETSVAEARAKIEERN